MPKHTYDHVMAWTSLFILYPVSLPQAWSLEASLLEALMIVFCVVSLQHWRHYDVHSLHCADVSCAHLAFVWHLRLGSVRLDSAQWQQCLRYAVCSTACFGANETLLRCRDRARTAKGSAELLLLVAPHAMFRYFAFAMVMTARELAWTWRFTVAYVTSIVLLVVVDLSQLCATTLAAGSLVECALRSCRCRRTV